MSASCHVLSEWEGWYDSACVKRTCLRGVMCTERNPYGTNGTEHALMVLMGLVVTLVTREQYNPRTQATSDVTNFAMYQTGFSY